LLPKGQEVLYILGERRAAVRTYPLSSMFKGTERHPSGGLSYCSGAILMPAFYSTRPKDRPQLLMPMLPPSRTSTGIELLTVETPQETSVGKSLLPLTFTCLVALLPPEKTNFQPMRIAVASLRTADGDPNSLLILESRSACTCKMSSALGTLPLWLCGHGQVGRL
jgi:hypothetical protein